MDPSEPFPRQQSVDGSAGVAHSDWLGCDWLTDAEQTRAVLTEYQAEWLVVDHYALDQRWEHALQSHCRKLMVIADLADRTHQCDLLLDQNLGRQTADYRNLVPADCKPLLGPQYALLRPEFAALRSYSLQRRLQPVLKNILISMGGVDQPNATGRVLQALKHFRLPEDCRITVVMGAQAPRLIQVQALAHDMPWPTQVLVYGSCQQRCPFFHAACFKLIDSLMCSFGGFSQTSLMGCQLRVVRLFQRFGMSRLACSYT